MLPSPSPPPAAPRQNPVRSTRRPPGEFWRVQHREPTPAIPSDSEAADIHLTHQHFANYLETSLEDVYTPPSALLSFTDALEYAFNVSTHQQSDPTTWSEAMKRPDADKWYEAALHEMQAMLDNKTWEL